LLIEKKLQREEGRKKEVERKREEKEGGGGEINIIKEKNGKLKRTRRGEKGYTLEGKYQIRGLGFERAPQWRYS